MIRTSRIFVAALAMFRCTLSADSITVGLPAVLNNGNCIPFACPGSFGTTTYQEVYSAAAFPGVFDIGAIDFFDTQHPGGSLALGTYTFTLSYTSKVPGGLDLTNPVNNITSGSQVFFSGSLPALSGGTLTFAGAPFLYNPAGGNLLLSVSISGASDVNPPAFLDQAQTQAQTGRAFFGTSPGGNDGGGLVTEFDTPAPEPDFTLVVITTLGLMSSIYRSRKSA